MARNEYDQMPVISGHEALERQRGTRKPGKKLNRREKKALKRGEKKEARLRKKQEKSEKKATKKACRIAACEEKKNLREQKKAAKRKKPGKDVPKPVNGTGDMSVKEKSKKASRAEAKKAKEKRLSAQKSIPYREMGREGICRVQDKYYS